MAAWSDLLDQINIFPVADADTGRNLRISLAPLRLLADQPAAVPRALLGAATGNAGNIAAVFLGELLGLPHLQMLPRAVAQGAQRARGAVADPKPGTMLSVFDALRGAMRDALSPPDHWPLETMVDALEKSVADTCDILPVLRQAGVVDAGALGMFIFLESFLGGIAGKNTHCRPVTERFRGKLKLPDQWQPGPRLVQHCVSAVIRPDGDPAQARRRLAQWGDSVVINQSDDRLKVHLHVADPDALQIGLAQMGQVIRWNHERIDEAPQRAADQPVHIMTDAAGSITLADARALDMTLLDSYLVAGDQAVPETLCAPADLYAAMVSGRKVSTAQASVFQRHQSYTSVVSRYDRVLYLCVGSVYTGNFDVATKWKHDNDTDDRLRIIDTGTASGRLGIVALATARYARQGHELAAVARFASEAVDQSRELVFLDQLKFLAAGGRISKTKGFLGDLLRKKPIITPTAHGAARVGVVRNRAEQLGFALKRLGAKMDIGESPLILLQFSDNRTWVEETAAREIQSLLPAATILLRPLSLTSGAHMGPGTWAVAFLPEIFNL